MARGRAVLAVALLGLAGRLRRRARSHGEVTGTPLDPPFEVSSTPLVDTDGEAYSLTEDTDKDLTLVFFGYTHCPDICGQVMATLAGTLDPARRRAEGPAGRGLRDHRPGARRRGRRARSTSTRSTPASSASPATSTTSSRSAAAWRSAVDQGEKLPSGGYEVTHGTQVLAIDGDDETPMLLERRRLAGPAGPRRHDVARRRMMLPMLSAAVPAGDPDVHPQPVRGRVAPRARADPCLRALHHPRHRLRDLARRAALGRPRRQARRGQRPRHLGRAVRPGRRPALPRHHRLAPLLRRGQEPGHRAVRLARRPRHLGRHRPGCRRHVDRGAAARHQAAAAARRAGARRAGGAGDRPVGQLVQPGALRPPDRPAVGPGDRRRPPARRSTST